MTVQLTPPEIEDRQRRPAKRLLAKSRIVAKPWILPKLWIITVVGILIAGFFAAQFLTGGGEDVRSGTTLVDAEGMAARWGIDVELLGTTAAGGLVDFRYQVVDPDKANRIIHDVELLPRLVVEETGETIALTSLPHSHGQELQLGGTYFFLFANANNAVKPGSLITVVLGDVRLEHIVAQG